MLSVRGLILIGAMGSAATGAVALGYVPLPSALDADRSAQPVAAALDQEASPVAPSIQPASFEIGPQAQVEIAPGDAADGNEGSLATSPQTEGAARGEPIAPSAPRETVRVGSTSSVSEPLSKSTSTQTTPSRRAAASRVRERMFAEAGSERDRMKSSYGKMIGSGALSTLLAVAPLANAAAAEPVAVQSVGNQLANALCACANAEAVGTTVTQFESFGLDPEAVAQAFGAAAFQSELGRCKNAQAIIDGYAAYKAGKDAQALDIAFAQGRVSAEVHAGTASAEVYQGSFVSLGNAGDAPSGQ